ncbi:MAG: response regulator, partial [Anaerolineales bacterium]
MSQKILICDDTPTVLDFLELVFEKQGFEVIRAGSGAYALEAAAEHHPDLLLVDAMMPGMDGFEVCRRLRAQPDTASETILMYSAIVGEEVRARALSAGADEFLGKMISHAELVSQVRDWLAARSAPGG